MAVELPLYRCHKVVRAARITDIQVDAGEPGVPLASVEVRLCLDDIGGVVTVDRAYASKHQPHAGGYYVRYEDGYESFSPAQAFEEGYAPVDASWRGLDISQASHTS